MKSNLGGAGIDGSDWLLEGSTDECFHAITRWSPEGNDLYECGKYLLLLTDLKFDKDNPIY